MRKPKPREREGDVPTSYSRQMTHPRAPGGRCPICFPVVLFAELFLCHPLVRGPCILVSSAALSPWGEAEVKSFSVQSTQGRAPSRWFAVCSRFLARSFTQLLAEHLCQRALQQEEDVESGNKQSHWDSAWAREAVY